MAIGSVYLPRGNKHWQPPAGRLRQIELVAAAASTFSLLDIPQKLRDILRREQFRYHTANHFLRRPAQHFEELDVRKHDARILVVDDDTLVERLQHGCELLKPIMRSIHGRSFTRRNRFARPARM